jgi:hypothetical protein
MKTSNVFLLVVVAIAGYAWLSVRRAQASPHAAGKCDASTVPGDWAGVL